MQYLVVGADGKEYGPASVDVLKQWAAENRLSPGSQLRDFNTGQVVPASSVPGLFAAAAPAATAVAAPVPPADWSQPPAPMAGYARPVPGYARQDTGMSDIWAALIRSVLAIVFFFFLHGIGLIVGAYGLYYAIRAQGKGHKYGPVAIVISAVTLGLIGIGWLLRIGV